MAIGKATLVSFPLDGNLSEEPEGLRIPNAFGTMTEGDNDVALVMILLVTTGEWYNLQKKCTSVLS
jgi:hypothetical protein